MMLSRLDPDKLHFLIGSPADPDIPKNLLILYSRKAQGSNPAGAFYFEFYSGGFFVRPPGLTAAGNLSGPVSFRAGSILLSLEDMIARPADKYLWRTMMHVEKIEQVAMRPDGSLDLTTILVPHSFDNTRAANIIFAPYLIHYLELRVC